MQIDLVSVYSFVAFLYLVGPTATWLILRRYQIRGVNLWCIGGIFLSLAIFLAAAKDQGAGFWILGASNILMFASTAIRIQALLDFVGKKLMVRMWAFLGVLYIISYEYLLMENINPLVYVLIVQVLTLGRMAYVSILIARQPFSGSIVWTGYTYALMAGSMMLMIIAILAGKIPADYLAPNIFTIGLVMTGVMSSLTGHLGIIGLILDRTRAAEAQALVAQANAESRLELGEQIAQLQRQHIIGEMSGALSHELSQPLTAGLWSAEVAIREIKRGTKKQSALTALYRTVLAIKKVTEVVDRVREFVGPSSPSKCEPFDCVQIANEVVQIARVIADKKSVQIEYQSSMANATMNGDKVQLSQVMLNLLVNAIDAAAETLAAQGRVWVTLESQSQWLSFSVEDNGQGLQKTEMNRLGEPFYTSKKNGLGLGLSIASNIVSQHAGSLRWGNCSKGGACFKVLLPRRT